MNMFDLGQYFATDMCDPRVYAIIPPDSFIVDIFTKIQRTILSTHLHINEYLIKI